VLAHPPPVTDHASIFHHARQAAPDEDRRGPGSTTAQTPRRNLAVDAAADQAGRRYLSGRVTVGAVAPGSRLVFRSVLSTCAGCEKSMVLLPDHGCYTPLTGTRRRDPGLD
jgi:hypothetical protein